MHPFPYEQLESDARREWMKAQDDAYCAAIEALGFERGDKAFKDIDIPTLMTTPARAMRSVPVGGSSLGW